ncbi:MULTISPECIES: hypothetical protein [unclassified Nonomuraea]|uniref:hypothetical protein n=1 Tax=unclassified Nonomuraea TaxID=2593643 RepID=UPI0033FE58F6
MMFMIRRSAGQARRKRRGGIDEITGWQVRMERGRVAELTRRGAAAWWRADATTGGVDIEWRKAAKARRQAVLLVLPPLRLTDDQSDLSGRMMQACADQDPHSRPHRRRAGNGASFPADRYLSVAHECATRCSVTSPDQETRRR